MSRSTCRVHPGRRRALAAMGIGLATAVAATGCAAGQIAATAEMVSAVPGSSGTVGPIALRNVELQYPPDGRYQAGDDARLTLVLVNTGPRDDALTAVRTEAASDVAFQEAGPAAGGIPTGSGSTTPTATPGSPTGAPTPSAPGTVASIPVPANGSVLAYGDGPQITLVGLTSALRASQTVRVTFTFRDAGDITLVVPVGVPRSVVPQPPPIDVSPTQQD